MSSFNVAILRHSETAPVQAAVTALKQSCHGIELVSASRRSETIQQIELPVELFDDAERAEELLAKVSSTFQIEIVWVLAQSTVEVFQYTHWQSGEIVRALICGNVEEWLWSRVEGEPEPWEAEAFAGEAVTDSSGKKRWLGPDRRRKSISGPHLGDYAVTPDAMKYARTAIEFYTS